MFFTSQLCLVSAGEVAMIDRNFRPLWQHNRGGDGKEEAGWLGEGCYRSILRSDTAFRRKPSKYFKCQPTSSKISSTTVVLGRVYYIAIWNTRICRADELRKECQKRHNNKHTGSLGTSRWQMKVEWSGNETPTKAYAYKCVPINRLKIRR